MNRRNNPYYASSSFSTKYLLEEYNEIYDTFTPKWLLWMILTAVFCICHLLIFKLIIVLSIFNFTNFQCQREVCIRPKLSFFGVFSPHKPSNKTIVVAYKQHTEGFEGIQNVKKLMILNFESNLRTQIVWKFAPYGYLQ